jgi:hypothetical protein
VSPATRIIDRLPSVKRFGVVSALLKAEFGKLSRWAQLGVLIGFGGLSIGVLAQLEGGDRGIAPLDSSSSFEVAGISVDEEGANADEARKAGWRVAQRKGWQMLWQKMHGSGGPGLSDGALDSIIEAIVVEDEQISEHRYIAKLGILFDRVRSSEILGISGTIRRSPPLLVLPVQWEGGTAQVFETRTEWQKAWARFRSGSSPINYVRPSGTGVDPLLLNAGQADRRGRTWWRMLLDQYGAADVIIPQVRLEHLWPGGPVIGHFTARYGPENRILGAFDLRVENSVNIPKLMDVGIQRMDVIYTVALNAGILRPDPSLVIEAPIAPEELGNVVEAPTLGKEIFGNTVEPSTDVATVQPITVQYVTPDAGAVTSIESGVRRVPGVKSLNTSSVAVGGTSVMTVQFAGDIATLKIGLAARGFRVEEGGGGLRISRVAERKSPDKEPSEKSMLGQ